MARDRDEAPSSFAEFVQRLGDGDADPQLAQALMELADKCHDQAFHTNQDVKGALTLKLKLTVTPKGRAVVGYQFAVKEPDPVRPESHFFVCKGGSLSTESPRQPRLPFDGEPRETVIDLGDARRNARSV